MARRKRRSKGARRGKTSSIWKSDYEQSKELSDLAREAINNKKFRRKACDPEKFEQALKDFGYQLDEKYIRFCLGWAALAYRQFGDHDCRLVCALKEAVGDAPAG